MATAFSLDPVEHEHDTNALVGTQYAEPNTHRRTDGEAAHLPYTVFTKHERWIIVFFISIAALFSPLTASVYFPAIPTIATAFNVSVEKINLTVTAYMILQGVSPTVWGSVADRKGRRLVFLICLLLLLISCIGLALVPTSAYWLLMVLRCFQAAGSASTVAVAFGTIADITSVEERGGFVGLVNIGPVLGPCVGPVIGGLLSDHLGWRSIFWFLAIATGVCAVAMFLFFPETLRSMVGNGSIPPPRWDRPFIPIIGESSRKGVPIGEVARPPPKPLPNPFKLFTHPDLLLLLAMNGISFSALYAVITTISSLFHVHYPFLSESQIGLCFLAVGGGIAMSTLTVGRLVDYQFAAMKKQVLHKRRTDREEKGLTETGTNAITEKRDDSEGSIDEVFPLERARLASLHLWLLITSICVVGYGWAVQAGTTLAVPLILQFILGYTASATFTVTQTLLLDLFPTQGSSVTAGNNLVRCLAGAAVVSVVTIITNAIGAGWTYTLFGGTCALAWPLFLLEIHMGPVWRHRRQAKELR